VSTFELDLLTLTILDEGYKYEASHYVISAVRCWALTFFPILSSQTPSILLSSELGIAFYTHEEEVLL
jgi:hypothetical protein